MNFRLIPASAAIAIGAALLTTVTASHAQNVVPPSPYGGTTVEDIIARVNDQIITRSDYDRAMAEVDQEARQRGATTMQEVAVAHKDLLRNLIDQQLWLSKGKELGITGDTELIKRLDEIRKQYHLETLEDLEKAAKEQGVSFEDFKQNIRNGIITQEVMRQEVGATIHFTPGEAERYYAQHKQEYARPESVRLNEILISTGDGNDPAKVAAAKAKADDLEARLNAGGDFSQLAKSFSDGPTAAQGGDLGSYQPGALPKLLEDKTFSLKPGQITEPILTRQGYVILKVIEHVPGGSRPYKEVQEQVEDAYYMSQMEPAIRAYLTKLREQSYIDIKPGYTDTGASPNETKPIYSAYTPPAPKKKAKVERTRFRETTHTFRQKSSATVPASTAAPAPAVVKASVKTTKNDKKGEVVTEKPGKKEKIRFGQKPRETLPSAPTAAVEDAGAGAATTDQTTASATPEPVNPLEPAAPEHKARFSERARTQKKAKHIPPSQPPVDALAPASPDTGEVADRQEQSAPLGLNGDTAKKKKAASTGEKTRLADRKKEPASQQPQKQAPQFTPAPQVPGAPAPADHPVAPQPQPQAPSQQ